MLANNWSDEENFWICVGWNQNVNTWKSEKKKKKKKKKNF